MLTFAGDSHVDATKAVSYQSLDSGLSTFCVAPIVSSATTGIYNFWAIGIDCCGETGEKFECYDSGDPEVKTGWVLPKAMEWDNLYFDLGVYVSQSDQRRDLFVEAAKKAEATHGIITPGDDAVFVRWTKDKKDDILKWEGIAVLLTIVFSAIWQIVVSFAMTRLYQRFQNLHRMHRMQQNADFLMEEDEEEDISARLHQFVQAAKKAPGGRDSDFGGFASRVGDKLKRENLEKLRPPLSFVDMCLMGVVVPYVVLMLCAILSTFAPCARIGHLILVPFWCMTAIMILALVATPNRTISGFFVLLCCTAGYYVGNVNYKVNMFHYCNMEDRRSYKGVEADDSPDIYWDAGKLKFDQSARN